MKIMLIMFSVVLLTGCQENTLEKRINDLGETPLEIIETINEEYGQDRDYSVSIFDDKIVATSTEETVEIDLSNELFYVAIAPYYETTHTCLIHSATGCGGELREETFHVSIIANDGSVVVDKEVTSMKNGFFELWLPRDMEGTVTISHNDSTSIIEISTFSGDNTCITTTKLIYES